MWILTVLFVILLSAKGEFIFFIFNCRTIMVVFNNKILLNNFQLTSVNSLRVQWIINYCTCLKSALLIELKIRFLYLKLQK